MTYSPMAFFPANFMLQTAGSHNDNEHHHHQQHQLPTSFHTFQDFQGVSPNHELGKRSMSSFSGYENGGGGGGEVEANMEDELSDDGLQSLGEKKKRLNMVQVKTLEKSFELGNKLEPERKMQLARALGLQPRQIAIWFQNRRARWKTKQLEKDYEILKRQFDAIKQENDALLDKNQKLHAEIMALKNRQENIETINLNKETDQGSCSNNRTTTTDHHHPQHPQQQQQQQSCDMNLNINSRTTVVVVSPPRPPPPPLAIDNNGSLPTTPSPHHHDPPMPFFINNNRPITGTSPPQFFHNFTTQKMHMDNVNVAAVKEESLCNLFGFDQQDHQANSSGFWPWMEQQHYN